MPDPLYVFIRRQGHSPDDSKDLVQGFFARILEKHYLSDADREKGKFRSFLLVALKRYMANEYHRCLSTQARRWTGDRLARRAADGEPLPGGAGRLDDP